MRVGGRLALLYIHQMNRVNSRNDLGHDDSIIVINNNIILYLSVHFQITDVGWQMYS